MATTQNSLDYIHATCKAVRAEKPIWVTETTQVGMFDADDRNQAGYPSGKRTAISSADGLLRIRAEKTPTIYDLPGPLTQ